MSAIERESSPWADMNPALLGLIFNRLADDERCRTVSAVNKHWGSAHRDHPPTKNAFIIKKLPVPSSLYRWFLVVARAGIVTTLMIDEDSYGRSVAPCFLPQLLAAASMSCVGLHHLCMPLSGASGTANLHSVSLLTNLKVLEFTKLHFVQPAGHFKVLTSLSKLKEMLIFNLECPERHVEGAMLQAMWETLGFLASARSLASVTVSTSVLRNDRLLDQVSLLEDIRELWVHLPTGNDRTANLAALTRLSSLHLSTVCRDWPFNCVHRLPMLEAAYLQFEPQEATWAPTGPLLRQQRLSSLLLRCHTAEAAADQGLLTKVLPPATPALGSLLQLGLVALGLSDLPREVMQCLTQLTYLDISGNCFRSLPPALTSIVTLKALNLAGNSDLEFRPGDARLLGALPDLRLLRLEVAGGMPVSAAKWTGNNASIFVAFGKELPHLDLRLVGDGHDLDNAWRMWN